MPREYLVYHFSMQRAWSSGHDSAEHHHWLFLCGYWRRYHASTRLRRLADASVEICAACCCGHVADSPGVDCQRHSRGLRLFQARRFLLFYSDLFCSDDISVCGIETSRLTIRCSEPGGSVAVAIVASRAP